MGNRHKVVWGRAIRLGAAALLAAATMSCGDVVRQGEGSSFLIIQALEAASGAEPDDFEGVLYSDTQTVVDDVPSVFADTGRVTMVLGMKDPALATSPSQANLITLTRYRVRYLRSDGRNTPGVDVPYPIDGGFTLTVGAGATSGVFEIVRHIAKEEAPLRALTFNGIIINTIAEVTFWGRDQTGREVSATGHMTINFGNFGDPE